MCEKRVQQDLMKINKDPPPGISVSPTESNVLHWNILLNGPEATEFDGGMFKLRMEFPQFYPKGPPSVYFFSKMFHPNVYPDGKICLDILQIEGKWSSSYDAAAVLQGVQAMLGDPNPESAANFEATELYLKDFEKYKKRVEEIVELSISDCTDEMINANK